MLTTCLTPPSLSPPRCFQVRDERGRGVYCLRAKPESNEMDSLNIKEKNSFMDVRCCMLACHLCRLGLGSADAGMLGPGPDAAGRPQRTARRRAFSTPLRPSSCCHAIAGPQAGGDSVGRGQHGHLAARLRRGQEPAAARAPDDRAALVGWVGWGCDAAQRWQAEQPAWPARCRPSCRPTPHNVIFMVTPSHARHNMPSPAPSCSRQSHPAAGPLAPQQPGGSAHLQAGVHLCR